MRTSRTGRVLPPLVGLALATASLLVLAPPVAGAVPEDHAARLDEVDAPMRVEPGAMTTIWVDPVAGADDRDGSTRAAALRTLAEAWRRIPMGTPLADHGYHILIAPGDLDPDAVPVYLESRHGTSAHPIIIEAADGPGTVTLPALNIFDTRYLLLLDVDLRSHGGDALHCERCDHLLLRGATVRGEAPESDRIGDLVKINQSQSVFIEGSDLSGASDNVVDLVAVQYASLRGNRIHDARDWCAYAKGGSAYVRVTGNEIFDCGTGGFTAGQGTGFQFMVAPWLQYEAMDVKVVNNLIHDVWGAALGVNGGYDILLAYNTLTGVGDRSHLLEFVAGGRSCDGRPGDPGRDRCAANLEAGGWGTTRVDDGTNFVRIPNRHVLVARNVIVNRTDRQVGDQHLSVAAPFTGAAQDGSGVAVPARFDDDLRFLGNVIWSGPATQPLGVGEGTGCADAASSCGAEAIRAANLVNTREVRLVAPGDGDLRLADPAAFPGAGGAIPPFTWDDAPPGIPPGRLDNGVPVDRDGLPRSGTGPPGAYR